jgi:hypothetical protein
VIRSAYGALYAAFSAFAINPREKHAKVAVKGSSLPEILARLVPQSVAATVVPEAVFPASVLAADSVSFQTFLVAATTELYLKHPVPAASFALDAETAGAELAVEPLTEASSGASPATDAAYTKTRRGLVCVAQAFEAIEQQRADGSFESASPELKARRPDAPMALHDAAAQIDVAHFKAALFGTVTHSNTLELLEARFSELDLDNSGKIDFAEFACGLMKWVGFDEDEE